jgi:hypothetical protein
MSQTFIVLRQQQQHSRKQLGFSTLFFFGAFPFLFNPGKLILTTSLAVITAPELLLPLPPYNPQLLPLDTTSSSKKTRSSKTAREIHSHSQSIIATVHTQDYNCS